MPKYTERELSIACLMFLGYFLVYGTGQLNIPPSALLYPATGIAVAALFFGGMRLWPFVTITSIVSGLVFSVPFPHLIALTITDTLEAYLGAWALLKANIDPLFRKNSDMISFLITASAVALITPTVSTFARLLLKLPYSLALWGHEYTGAVFALIIVTPFLLRWCAKPSFNRPANEAIETVAVFALLITIDAALFVFGIPTIFGIYLIYLLLLPFLWIALRLRPRFVTLALLITSLFAVYNVLAANSTPTILGSEIFGIETFIITIAVIFLTIVSLEEDRRLNTNLMRSQLATLENAVARISSESQAKNDFIAILAHELRNPLAPVVSAIDYLRLKERDAEEMEMLEMMEYMMQTVRRLLDDLLDVSRISEGKLTIKKDRIELEPVLKHAILAASHVIKERHQNIVYQEQRAPLFVLGDRVRLEQIFSNLLTNASKYSDPGDTITVSMQNLGDQVAVRIKDNGIGIPPESIQHIFTPFHQVGSGKRTQKGLGIGLALVQSFVKVHGGTVTAESAGPRQGSTFTVTLPLLKNNG